MAGTPDDATTTEPVTIGRAFSDTYAGIRPADIAGFVAAQAAGATVGGVVFAWLVPRQVG